jgi:fructose-bisphosphate aldolase class II
LGASRTSGGPSGDAAKAARISARQRKVLPLPAGPRRKCACTDFFSRKDAQSQSNLLLKIGKGWWVGGRVFCFLLEKSFYYSFPSGKSRLVDNDDQNRKLMPLTHTKELFAKALKGKYALGAFNVNNMELIQAIVEACEEEKAPLILQISKGARQYANPVYLKKLIEAAVSLSNVPIAVHLDHGDTFELCKQCIDEGFTSVMIDASHEPFDKNTEICKKVVDYAHKYNCSVEGELGHLVGAQFDEGEEGGGHSTSGHYTNPEEAVKFVRESGVDSLAVAIGNSHGAYKFKGEQHLDLERLKAIKKALMDANLGDYPLVLHGASSVPQYLVAEINKYGGKMPDAQGVPEADIEVARRVGCTKVNIDTDLRLAMTAGIRKVFSENPKEFDPRKYLGPARAYVKDLVRHKVKDVLCCAGHAFD